MKIKKQCHHPIASIIFLQLDLRHNFHRFGSWLKKLVLLHIILLILK